MFGSIALGIWLGPKITERTGKAWLAWAVGIGLLVTGAVAQGPLGEFFGVSDRLEGLIDPECYTDWDRRSNPIVCE